MWEDKRKIYRESDLDIIVPSQWLKSIVEKSILKDKPIHLIYNGIDPELFKPRDNAAVRQKLNIPQNATVLAFVANKGLRDDFKGGDLLLQAYKYLAAKYPDLYFLCIGGQPQNETMDRFIQVPHISDEKVLAHIYSAADAFIYPTIADNCPLVVLEAMGCGIPVVSFDVGGVSELIDHGQTGLLAPKKDANTLIQLTEKLITDPNMRHQFGIAARQKLLKKFTITHMTDQYVALYHGIIEKRKSSSRETNRKVVSLPKNILQPSTVNVTAPHNSGEYLVSAIVSTYNSEKFFRGCLEDLEAQTIADKLEIIVVNSNSEQNEDAIVKEFQKKYNNITYIKTDQREGLYTAWNRAVKIAKGQFLTNANTDDRHQKDAFEILANTLLENPDIALAYGDQIVTDTPNPTFDNHHVVELVKRPEYSHQRLLFGCCVGSQPMWRKSLHDEIGCFDESLSVAADWDFWLRISEKYPFKHVPQTLGLYFYNDQGVEHCNKIHSLYERYLVGKRYGNPYISIFQVYQAKGNPLVSVIIPVYNAEKYIASAIESVLIQNYRNFEVIVIDDGSTDNTKQIIDSFGDEKIRCFYQPNAGLASSHNAGIKKSKGQFLIKLDADDIMTPDFIEKHLKIFEQFPETDLVYCDDTLVDEGDKVLRVIRRPEYSDTNLLIRDLFQCGFPVVPFRTCIKRSVFDKIGFFDETLCMAEDYDMICRFVKSGLKIKHLPEPLYFRRMTTNSLSRDSNLKKAQDHFKVVKRFTQVFTPQQLFPETNWQNIPEDQKKLLAKCRVALAFLAIGNEYIKTQRSDYSSTAFEFAHNELNECLRLDPQNPQILSLLEKCKALQTQYSDPAAPQLAGVV